MSSSKPSLMVLFFLIFCMTNSFKLSHCIGSNSIIFCPEIEKQALISFKQSLEDPSNLLSSWNIGQVNCCNWKGVVCSNLTGHVHQLHLQSRRYRSQGLRGKINPSLLNLKYLRYLDLSRNNFREAIPSFIGSFTSLEYLNLSHSGFHGTIPNNIGNLANLRSLSLEDYQRVFDHGLEYYDSELDVNSIEWLSGLSQLEYLNMNYVNLSKAINWVQVINTLPSLVELHFSSCDLSFMAPLRHANISLAILDLSENNFECSIPKWIFQQSNLISLDLSFNSFEGPIPATSNTTKLQSIDLSYNYLNSSIPDWVYFCKYLQFVSLGSNSLQNTISHAIGNLTTLNTLNLSYNELSGKIPGELANMCKMQMLDLSRNELQGEISDSFRNMSDCFLGGLKVLRLGWNQLSGQITDQFAKFKSLQTLNLNANLLSGAIPVNLGKVSPLQNLRLGQNKLTGNLPESIGQLFNLVFLGIRNTMLEGVVTESHLANLTKLKYLYASGCHLTLKARSNWIPPFELDMLRLGSWNLGAGSAIPTWIEQQENIWDLDLSDTGISGNIPSWVWEIRFLNLSHNQLRGKIPDINPLHRKHPKISDINPLHRKVPGIDDVSVSHHRLIYLSSNKLSGSLPRVAKDVTELDLSDNLFSGSISHFLCDMTNETHRLKILHLGGNQLTGQIPDCWMKWPSLEYLNLGNNNMFGGIPNSTGFLVHLLSLNLYGNKFSGQIPFSMHNCIRLVKIDVAGNYLIGNIPTWMGTSLANLRFLILRSNKLSGEISSNICHLNSLQILDLSDNNFSGIIPRCVDNFTAMASNRSLAEYGSFGLFYSYSVRAFAESVPVFIKGSKFYYDTVLLLVTNIDLSNNNLSGDIPKELTSLVKLRSLNLSRNHLIGLIPNNIGDMKQLESLDLSRNSLAGDIPDSFKIMSFLNHLDLSYNNLIGRIPRCTQLMGMNASSFIGNNLCGPPLPRNCSHVDDEPLHNEEDKGVKSEIDWFYVFLSLGYAVGLSVVFAILVLNKSWRETYFGLLECMWSKIYVYSYSKFAKLMELSGQSLCG